MMGNWADMVPDILLLIARRLYLYKDYVIFGGVCGTWRFVATKDNFNNLHLHLPRLMLSENKDDSIHREFYSLPDPQIHKVVLPEVSGKRCCSMQGGWIFTLGKVGDVNLLHPATRSLVTLPNLQTFADLDNTFPDLEEEGGFDGEYMQSMFIEKVALSTSDPCALTSTNNFIVMVLYGSTRRLGFYKGGDDGWSMVHTFQAAFFDVIYHKGLFYAVDCRGRLFACDPTANATTITAELVSVWPAYKGVEKLYLVASSSGDKLLVVSREGVHLDAEDNYETTRFRVFEFEQQNTNIDNGGKWEEVESIGDEAMFLGDNSSVSISVYDEGIVGCKANCIYFTDDCLECYQNQPSGLGGGKDMGVYHLKDGSFEPHFKGQSYSIISPPLWVMPTPLPQLIDSSFINY